MDLDLIDPVLGWISANPAWAGVVVMLIAFFESLALVGLFLPGAVLMFGVGALVGAGTLPLWPTLLWAAVGAIGGDGVSFWLGKRYHQRIRTVWPLRRHPELLAQSTDFFHRHGGKSILLGRFVGPIRPVIPLVAGMLEMPTSRFIPVNVISGLLWAPVYVLPGMVFAASLGVAAEVATRLALLLGTLLALLLLVLWLSRRLFNLYHRHAYRLLRGMLAWMQRHPRLGHLPAALLDPEHPEARGLTLLGLLLLVAGSALLWVLQAAGSTLPNLDQVAHNALAALRSPWADRFLFGVAILGSRPVLLALFAGPLLWLLGIRQWQAAWHWGAAVLFAFVFSLVLQWLFGAPTVPGPAEHLIYATVLYGFLAVLLGRDVRERWRWLAYGVTLLLLCTIGLAQLYFASERLSALLANLTLGLLWVALLGIAYLRHESGRPCARPLLLVALLAIVGVGSWYHANRYDSELSQLAVQRRIQSMNVSQWQHTEWATLPAERGDVRGRHSHPLTLQYAGSLMALQQLLAPRGWQPALAPDAVNWMQWLALHPDPATLPVLPQVHDGQHQRLLLVKRDGERLLALRLWASDYRLQPDGEPLWLGNVSYLITGRVLGTLTIPHTAEDFRTPLNLLFDDLQTLPWPHQWRNRSDGTKVLLLEKGKD